MPWVTQSWAYINGHAIRNGVDLMALEPNDLFDVIEVELEDYLIASGQTEDGEGIDMMRHSVMQIYSSDYSYIKFKSLYGTKDTNRSRTLVDDGIQADDPFGRTNSRSGTFLTRTEQTEAGFVGLDAPLN